MDIELAVAGRMTPTGSYLLRSLQNHETPLLDLIVRESIQNSLDAVLPTVNEVSVQFRMKEFDVLKIADYFSGIGDELKSKYGATARLLEIRDTNTFGLTGHLNEEYVDESSQYGNLLKLVYHIGRPQENEGAGGSWGLGKTVYYRAGIGLVVFYSRIQTNINQYESRLAACLIENEKSDRRILPSPLKGQPQGIAWWGKRVNLRFRHDENQEYIHKTEPTIDESEIYDIINSFGVEPYKDDQTGTTVIIPFLRDNILDEVRVSNEAQNTDTDKVLQWCSSEEKYLNLAVQKWYAPRIDNDLFPYGPSLKVSINDKLIRRGDLKPIFKVISDLYRYAQQIKASQESIEQQDYRCVPISMRMTFAGEDKIVGWLCFGAFSEIDMKMGPPYNEMSPKTFITNSASGFAEYAPLLAFTRSPGMIVNYDFETSWIRNYKADGSNGYVIGLFIANSKNLIKHAEGNHLLLEQYLRGCEKADHAKWDDNPINGISNNIVKKIRQNLVNALSDYFNDRGGSRPINRETALSRILADKLLPVGFGSRGSDKFPNTNSGHVSRIAGSPSSLALDKSPTYFDSGLSIDYEVKSSSKIKSMTYELRVITETGEISVNEWLHVFGSEQLFPITLKRLTLKHVSYRSFSESTDQMSLGEKIDFKNKFTINPLVAENGQWCAFIINFYEFRTTTIHISLELETHDRLYQVCLSNTDKQLLKGEINE